MSIFAFVCDTPPIFCQCTTSHLPTPWPTTHTPKYTSSSEVSLSTPLQSCSSNWGFQLHYPRHGEICDHTQVHKDSSSWSLKLKLRENKRLALKSASWTKQITRNNFSQNGKSEETSVTVPDPGSSCYLSQNVLLPSLKPPSTCAKQNAITCKETIYPAIEAAPIISLNPPEKYVQQGLSLF